MADSMNKQESLFFTMDDFLKFFKDKVDDIWHKTECAVEPMYSPSPGCHFNKFSSVSPDDVIKVISATPYKQSSLDPWPSWLLKECTTDVSPFIAAVCNLSMSTEQVPLSLKEADITPLLKKLNIDKGDITNYLPISNLSVLSKLLECVISKQLVAYLDTNGLYPKYQSAYRAAHSTETTHTAVFSALIQEMDTGNITLLSLLDLSAAFDCVDHEILLNRLWITYGLESTVIKCSHLIYLIEHKVYTMMVGSQQGQL